MNDLHLEVFGVHETVVGFEVDYRPLTLILFKDQKNVGVGVTPRGIPLVEWLASGEV